MNSWDCTWKRVSPCKLNRFIGEKIREKWEMRDTCFHQLNAMYLIGEARAH